MERRWSGTRGEKTTKPQLGPLNVRGACIKVCEFLPDEVGFFGNMGDLPSQVDGEM